MKISRLSPYNIADDLTRSAFYREMKAANLDWQMYEIQPDEAKRPELVSYRFYGTDEMKWLVMLVCGLDDPRTEIEPGTRIILPPIAYVRERIKHYSGQ